MGPGWGWILFESNQLPSNHLQASVLAQRCQKAHHGRQGARTGRVLGAGPPTSTCLQGELGVWAQSLWSLGEDQKGGALNSSPGQMMQPGGLLREMGTLQCPLPSLVRNGSL